MEKRKITAIVFLLAFALSISSTLASAEPLCSSINGCNTCGFYNCCGMTGMTIIKGAVYEGDLSNGIRGANVAVTCYHEGSEHTRNALSWHGGKYIVFFQQSECKYGDNATVSAEKDGMTGANSGSVNVTSTAGCFTLDVGIVNVPLIPEFGMIIGTLTVISAVGVFFLVRRN